ncbi:MAG: endonuclease/exonuclease/phosphatase family protein [Treponema sp.]|jgi:endonuclease/exonuclease/phosphatase family metal-dependent hydrolase|nr:endonuclease/exonuclease/phosphatase family protein [Treponema sp.]
MKKMEKIVIVLVLLSVGSCEMLEKSKDPGTEYTETLRIGTWNVQTLFDGEETGTEYAEYRSSAGWTDEKYRARLNAVAHAVNKLPEKTPDILGLIEIENLQILEHLVQGPLAKQGYNWLFFGNNPGASLGIGVASRFPFEETMVHSITSNGETTPRPILEIRLQIKGNLLICLVCHWKSKAGGGDTESLRKASARVILRRLRELKQEAPDIPVIIMGDLNENPDEFYRKADSTLSALVPDDPSAVERTGSSAQMDFLILSQNKPPKPEYFGTEALVLYSPWEKELEEGSYYYKDEWEAIDYFLLSDALFDQTGWDFDSCKVIKQEPFITNTKLPYRYDPKTGNGLSDHLPLILTLKQTKHVK